jgi:hypothetical protein
MEEELENVGTQLLQAPDFIQMSMRFILNLVVIWLIVHTLYYPKSRRRDYYFTFILISISIFFLVYLLGGVKVKVGFALGLFAIFGIIRYRTESMPVREMTYLFAIIALSVINALADDISLWELLTVNIIFIISIWICESNRWLKHMSCKIIRYDRIDLIKPDKKDELKADLEQRTGLKIKRIEVGSLDFMKDMAMLRIFYEAEGEEINTTDALLKLPKEE